MRTAALNDICDLITDGTHYTPPHRERGVPFLTVKDMTDEGLCFDKSARMSEADFEAADRANCAPRAGDVLFSKDGTVGKVSVVVGERKFAVLSSIAILRPKRQLMDPLFLAYALRSPAVIDAALQRRTGSALRRIILKDLQEVRINVPPLRDQRRIAAILDQAEALRAKRRAALAHLDEMARAIFVEMFGDLEANDRSWPVSRVASYVAAFQGGKSFESDPDNAAARYRVLKVSAVTGSVFKPHENKPLPDAYVPPADHFVRPGDLLFSRANTTELVGAVAYVHSSPDNLVLPDKLWRFVWRDTTPVEPLFIWALFQQQAVKEEIGRRATGTSGSMKNISQEKLLGMETILPPVAVQRAFVSRLIAVQEASAKGKKSALGLDSLFTSLQHRAFRGEL